jgi:phytoene dehydrogenase-like protein
VRHYSTAILPDWLNALADLRDARMFLGQDPGPRMVPYSFVA